MNWNDLFSSHRLCQTVDYPRDAHRPPWQFDCDRIVFSSAFRRLQDKTQVFPLSSSDYVRTRLTHSLEVSSVARTIGTSIGHSLCTRHTLEIGPMEIGMIAAAAALAHDIGNPPFGHSGEDAIRAWYNQSRVVRKFRGELTEAQQSDFENYEGNAQGFRALARLNMYRNSGGMRLTAATLAAFTKYPVTAPIRGESEMRKCMGQSTHKFGVFQDDLDLFREVAASVKLEKRNELENCWCRHPLAFLVEAADDICYRIIDLEDAYRQHLISYGIVFEIATSLLSSSDRERVEKEDSEDSKMDVIRSLVISKAVAEVCNVFLNKEGDILSGRFDAELLKLTTLDATFKAIKGQQKERVYKNNRVLRVETAGFTVIAGLLEGFVKAVQDVWMAKILGKKVVCMQSQKLFDLLPAEFSNLDPEQSSFYTRTLKVVDYVAGMSDSFALNLYRNISGISLP